MEIFEDKSTEEIKFAIDVLTEAFFGGTGCRELFRMLTNELFVDKIALPKKWGTNRHLIIKYIGEKDKPFFAEYVLPSLLRYIDDPYKRGVPFLTYINTLADFVRTIDDELCLKTIHVAAIELDGVMLYHEQNEKLDDKEVNDDTTIDNTKYEESLAVIEKSLEIASDILKMINKSFKS